MSSQYSVASSELERFAATSEMVNGETIIAVAGENLMALLKWLRDTQNFKQLVDVCGADYPAREKRFDVVYQLLDFHGNRRVRVKVMTDADAAVPSASELFPSAIWFERETFDMYGVPFSNHPDLRRILTDYGFEGHPQRKDFPLTGYVELRYDEVEKRVVYEPVKLQQAYRSFDYLSPWEGPEYVLPGDEKAKANG